MNVLTVAIVPRTPQVPRMPQVPRTSQVPRMPQVPRTPQVPQVPELPELPDFELPFSFGLSTITDFIGLTDPDPPPASSAPISAQDPQTATPSTTTGAPSHQQENRQQGTFSGLLGSEFSRVQSQNQSSSTNLKGSEQRQQEQNENRPLGNKPNISGGASPASFAGISRRPSAFAPGTVEGFGSQDYHNLLTQQLLSVDGSTSLPMYSSSLSSYPYTDPFTIPSTTTTTASFQTLLHPQIVMTPSIISTHPTTGELLYDPTRRSASPTTSGVQIELINLRQKLFRDIENNVKVVTEQKGKIQNLHNRADSIETEYTHLKCEMEELKRKQLRQESKLQEIDSRVKSALTMSSFHMPSSLELEMIEDGNDDNETRLVVVERVVRL